MQLPIKKLDRWITFPVVLFIYVFVGYLSFSYPGKILSIQLPFSLVSIFSIIFILMLSFRKKISFASNLSIFSGFRWLFFLYLGLSGFLIANLLIQGVLTNFNPYVAKLYISNDAYWEAVRPIMQPTNWVYWGYFSALVILGGGLSYVHYYKQSVPCLHRIAGALFDRVLTHRKPSIWAKSFGEGHVYLVNLTWFGLVLISAVVLLASGLLSLINLPSYFTLPIISMSFFSLIFLLFASTFLVKKLKKLNKKHIDLAIITLLFCVLLIGILLLAGKAIQLVLMHQPDILKAVECDCTINKLKLFIQDRMQVLGWSIWILNLPLIATFVSRISANRTLLQLIAAIIGYAILLQLGVYFYSAVNHFDLYLYDYLHRPVVELLFGAGLLIFLFFIFFRKRTTWIMSNGFMKELPRKDEEGADIYKVSEISFFDGTKIKGLGMLTRKWMLMCMGLLLVHTLGGWQVIQVELGVFAFILCAIYFFALVGLLIEFLDRPSGDNSKP